MIWIFFEGCYKPERDTDSIPSNGHAVNLLNEEKNSAYECFLFCQENSECENFAWVSSKSNLDPTYHKKCYLKKDKSGSTDLEGVISGDITSECKGIYQKNYYNCKMINSNLYIDLIWCILENTQTHDTEEVICTPKNGGWSDWKESDDSTCIFNEETSLWTKESSRVCDNPEPQFGGLCEGIKH